MIQAALAQSWPPFVLVTGLLLIGQVAGGDGLFDAAASRLADLPGSSVLLLSACYALVAVVTVLLNLDTAAVFLTPVLVRVAQRRALHPAPFLYGCVFMLNSASLFLPGSNLTNLLVLGEHRSGGEFLTSMLPVASSVTVASLAGLLLVHRRLLTPGERIVTEPAPLVLGPGLWSALAAAALMVALRNAALGVLALGVLAAGLRVGQGRLPARVLLARLGLGALVGLFCLVTALGVLARATGFPGEAMHSASPPLTAIVAVGASVLLNNLPAAALLSATHVAHPQALLLGLNVGPNLAVTGSLSVLLWWRAAREAGLRPSALAYSRQGLLLVPFVLAVGLLAVGLTPYA